MIVRGLEGKQENSGRHQLFDYLNKAHQESSTVYLIQRLWSSVLNAGCKFKFYDKATIYIKQSKGFFMLEK